jgi:putative hydrolase of the HAD superfamily
VTRAVVFDLWDTLVDYDDAVSRSFTDAAADAIGRERDSFARLWREGRPLREIGPLADYLASVELDEGAIRRVTALRREWARQALVPRPGAVETLRELRSRGLRVGLISVCSDDVPAVWSGTQLAGLFDSEVFSCDVGLRKPDPRIYALACEQLGVAAHDALFVGDGANDELAGAERAGLRAVLIHRPGEEPPWPEAQAWSGPRVTALPELLDLL